MKTNICLENAVARVKKYSALGRVCRERKLKSISETIEVTNLQLLEPLILDGRLKISPDEPIRGLLGLRVALSSQLQARLLFTSERVTPFPGFVIPPLVALYMLTLQSSGQDQLIFGLTDQDGDLLPGDGDYLLAYARVALQESAVRLMMLGRLGQGPQYALIGISLPLPTIASQLSAETNFYKEDGVLKASYWSFELSGSIAGLKFVTKTEFEREGLRKAGVRLGISF